MDADKLTMVRTPARCVSRPGLPDLRSSQQWLPFSDFHTEFDVKRKGLRILVCVSDDWKTTAMMAPAGICILDHPSYHEIKLSIFFQCTNCDAPTVGHICLAQQCHQGSTRQRRPRFSAVRQPGPIPDCFLAIPQAIYFESGVPVIVFHRLDNTSQNVSSMMEKCAGNRQLFVKESFRSNHEVLPLSDIEFCPLNSIAGSLFSFFQHRQLVHCVGNKNYIEMRQRPDTWVNEYLDPNTSHLAVICMKNMQWLPGEGLVSRRGKRQRSGSSLQKNPYERCGLHRLRKSSRNASNVYLCNSRPPQASTKQGRGPVLEYCTLGSAHHRVFAELMLCHHSYLKDIEQEYEFLQPDQYEDMLDYLLSTCGRQRTWLVMLNVGKNTTNTSMISVMNDNEAPPDNAVRMMHNVWCRTLSATRSGALSVDRGLVVQHIYKWPFVKNFAKDHIELVKMFCGGTPRGVTKMDNLYQNFGPRSTFQCPAALGAHPQTKANHDAYCRRQNINLAHQALPAMRNSLRQQSHLAGFTCGSVLSPTLKLVSACNYTDLRAPCLFTLCYSCTPHVDPDLASYEDSNLMRSHWAANSSDELQRFSKAIQTRHPEFQGRLPLETTCAWTIGEKNEDYEMRACFANLTAGVGLDISSNAISDTDVVGCTFVGACFEHCSTKPIWIRKEDGCVRMTPPPETPLFCVFAWGDHVQRARERARLHRQDKVVNEQSAERDGRAMRTADQRKLTG